MKKIKFTVIVFGLALVLSACSGKAQSTAELKPYTADITPENFVAAVDNVYFPLAPGTKWVYESHLKDGGVERNEIEVLTETREIMGVTATVVHDLVYLDGQIIEGTYDWYAQDKDGNVWYLGEAVDNYEKGEIKNHDGSWEWGVDGALPGVIMWGDPSAHLNEAYRQEFYRGHAEDQGQVLSVNENVTVPFGAFENVVMTYDFSSLDKSLQENKFYAAGIGVIKEVDTSTGEEAVLIEFTAP